MAGNSRRSKDQSVLSKRILAGKVTIVKDLGRLRISTAKKASSKGRSDLGQAKLGEGGIIGGQGYGAIWSQNSLP